MPDTSVTLKEYVDRRICAIRDYFEAKIAEREKAAVREIAVIDERLSKMNEIPAQLNDQYSQFHVQLTGYLSRTEYDAKHAALVADARRIEGLLQTSYVTIAEFRAIQEELRKQGSWQANMTGRLWGIFILIGLVIVVVQTIIHLYSGK